MERNSAGVKQRPPMQMNPSSGSPVRSPSGKDVNNDRVNALREHTAPQTSHSLSLSSTSSSSSFLQNGDAGKTEHSGTGGNIVSSRTLLRHFKLANIVPTSDVENVRPPQDHRDIAKKNTADPSSRAGSLGQRVPGSGSSLPPLLPQGSPLSSHPSNGTAASRPLSCVTPLRYRSTEFLDSSASSPAVTTISHSSLTNKNVRPPSSSSSSSLTSSLKATPVSVAKDEGIPPHRFEIPHRMHTSALWADHSKPPRRVEEGNDPFASRTEMPTAGSWGGPSLGSSVEVSPPPGDSLRWNADRRPSMRTTPYGDPTDPWQASDVLLQHENHANTTTKETKAGSVISPPHTPSPTAPWRSMTEFFRRKKKVPSPGRKESVEHAATNRSSELEVRSDPAGSEHERGEPQDGKNAVGIRADAARPSLTPFAEAKKIRGLEGPFSRLLPPSSPSIPATPPYKEPFSHAPPPMMKAGFASSVPERRRRHYLSHDVEGGRGRRQNGAARGRRENENARGEGGRAGWGGSLSHASDLAEEEEGEEEEMESDAKKNKEKPNWWTRWGNFFRGIEERSDSDSDEAWPSRSSESFGGRKEGEDSPPAETIIDLGAAFRAYLNLYSEGMFNLVEAALSVRSDEAQNLVTLEELQQARENAVLIRLMVVRKVLNLEDPKVQAIVNHVGHRLIEESSGDQLNPTLEIFLEAFFPLPFFSLTEEEYLILTRSGFEFVSLMHRYRHVLPKGKFCFSIRLMYSVGMLYSEILLYVIGFLLNFFMAVGVVIEIAFWFARNTEEDSVSRGFYACIGLVGGYLLLLMTVTVVLRPPLLVSRSVLPHDRKELSLYATVFPLFPVYDFIGLFSLAKVRKRQLQLLDEHNFFASSRIMMCIFCLFYGLPQAFIATALVNVGKWSEFSSSDPAVLPSQFVRTLFIVQFIVMMFRIAFSCWAYSSVHLLGFGWPSISTDRFGMRAHDGTARLLIIASPFLGLASLFLLILSILEAITSNCWERLYIISGISCLSVIVVVIVCAIVLRLTHRGIASLLFHGGVCGVLLSSLLVGLWVLILPYRSNGSTASSENVTDAGDNFTDAQCREQKIGVLFSRFSSGIVIQSVFFFIFLLWLTSMLYFGLRYGCGVGMSLRLKECAESLAGMCCTNANSEEEPLPIDQTSGSK